MSSPSLRTPLVAAIGGVAHLGAVEFLFRRLGHVPDSLWPLASVTSAVSVFAFGFLVVLLSVHTRVLSPVVGLPTLLAWATYRDLASPTPEWSELGGHLVVDGSVYLTSYVGTWYVWLATFVVLAAVEYGPRAADLTDHKVTDRLERLISVAAWRRTRSSRCRGEVDRRAAGRFTFCSDSGGRPAAQGSRTRARTQSRKSGYWYISVRRQDTRTRPDHQQSNDIQSWNSSRGSLQITLICGAKRTTARGRFSERIGR